jgi:hypothetical protein
MLRVVKPVPFTLPMLVSSTATDAAAWSAGTYAVGAIVTHNHPLTGMPRNWYSLVADNTETPGMDANKWQDSGPSNKTAMFDNRISSQTLQTSSDMVVEYAPGQTVTTLALLNVRGFSATVEVFEDSVLTYTHTVYLTLEPVLDWFAYFTAPSEPLTRAIFSSVPIYYSSLVRITVTGTSTAIGHCVAGMSYELGEVKYGATSGIIDYSLKETDEEFGGTVFVERDFADENTFAIRIPKVRLNRVKQLLRSLRATPCLWIGSDEEEYTESLTTFGWYRSHSVVIEYHDESTLDLEIEGLT